MSIALFEAMKTNKTVRSLNVCVASLEEPHLTAIVDSLLENDTLQTFSVSAGCANACPIEDVDAAFLRILERNMCLRELDIRKVRPVAEDELEIDDSDDPTEPMDLGATVMAAIERNKQAWIVAQHLGQLNRSNLHDYQNLGDIVFRRQILMFFLQKGCKAPPRQMLHIAEGLPKQ